MTYIVYKSDKISLLSHVSYVQLCFLFLISGIVLWVFDVKFISYLDYQIASVTTEHGTCVYQVMFVLDVSLVFYKPKVLGKFR